MTDEQIAELLGSLARNTWVATPENAACLRRAAHVLRTAPQMEKALAQMLVEYGQSHWAATRTVASGETALAAYREGR